MAKKKIENIGTQEEISKENENIDNNIFYEDKQPEEIIGSAKRCTEKDCWVKQGKTREIIPSPTDSPSMKNALAGYKKVIVCDKKECCLIFKYIPDNKPKKQKKYIQKKIEL